MAKKTEDQGKAAAADTNAAGAAAAAPADQASKPEVQAKTVTKEKAAAAGENAASEAAAAPASPAPATDLENPSGAIMEPALARSVDLSHESVDANPRAGTTAVQNATDWNDAKRAKPQDEDFAGQGLDRSVYGKGKAD